MRAAGLPELVATDHRDFVARAIEYARTPRKLALLRDRLARNRANAPLFDTALRVRELETAFAEMARRARAGLRPAPFRVLASGATA